MKNNSILLIIVLLSISLNVFGQRKKVNQLPSFDKHDISWGFYLGWNSSDYKIEYQQNSFPNTNIYVDSKMGFNIGLIGNIRISKHFNLRLEPGLISNESTLYFIDQEFLDGNNPTDLFERNPSTQIESTFLHVPVLMKFNANRLNNIRPYVIGGLSYDYNFSSNQENKDDNFSGQFRMKKHNMMYEVGFGFDFYFPHFKFSPSLRGQFAMRNEVHYDNIENGPSPWTDPIAFMGTRSMFIKFAFE